MIVFKELLTPTTDSSAESDTFDVDERSRVIFIAPDADEDLTDDDAFELRKVLEEDPLRSMAVVDDGAPVLLGANNIQIEVLIRGTYLVRKILATTEAVGVYGTYGIEEGG